MGFCGQDQDLGETGHSYCKYRHFPNLFSGHKNCLLAIAFIPHLDFKLCFQANSGSVYYFKARPILYVWIILNNSAQNYSKQLQAGAKQICQSLCSCVLIEIQRSIQDVKSHCLFISFSLIIKVLFYK